MKRLTPLIQTQKKGDLSWQVIPVPGGFYVEHFNSATDAIEKGYFFAAEFLAIRCMVGIAADEGSEVDWSSLVVCRHIVAQTECKDYARDEVTVLRSDAELEAFKRNQLADYPSHYDDSEEVDRLLEAGKIDEAWTMALSDDPDEKQLWNTHFGDHSFSEHTVNLTDLPVWLQNTIKSAISA